MIFAELANSEMKYAPSLRSQAGRPALRTTTL